MVTASRRLARRLATCARGIANWFERLAGDASVAPNGSGLRLGGIELNPPVGSSLTSRITAEHVVWGYRLFLDREPESDAVVAEKVRVLGSLRAMREDFMGSYEFRRANPQLGYASERCIVLKELGDGLRIYLDLADAVISRDIARDRYEPAEREFVRHVVRPGDVVVDIGANLGFFTLLLASLVGATGRVIAFEPLSQNVELLRRSIKENRFQDRVMLIQAALSDVAGDAELVIGRHFMNSGGGFLDRPGVERQLEADVESVQVYRLDDLDLPRPVTFVKIDVEGAEGLALRGAANILSADRPIVMSEINTRQLGMVSGMPAASFIAGVEAFGYECLLLHGEQLVLDDGDPQRPGIRTVVFVPSGPSPLRSRVEALMGDVRRERIRR